MGAINSAIISVYSKEGAADVARALQELGVEILSSGGTARHLEAAGVDCTAISDYTGAPEILDGRVKTLHPKIFAGILARSTPDHQAQLEQQDARPIDLVLVNLYPFRETVAQPGATRADVVEMIDIGGPSLVRAAAKNHERVTVVVDPADYEAVLREIQQEGQVCDATRARLAAKAFAHTARYDEAIAAYLQGEPAEAELPERIDLALTRLQPLRYGENPHQRAAVYVNPSDRVQPAIVNCQQLQGKELSYNNFLDADAALNLLLDLEPTGVCILKHTNPCGAATEPGGDAAEVFKRALATDPVSAFGGIVGCNVPVTAALAAEMKPIFLEAVIAPEFEPDALAILKKKRKLRLLRYAGGQLCRDGYQLRSVSGGMLVQQLDSSIDDLRAAEVVTKRAPTDEELAALGFAWRICKHVKSNAIVLARKGQLVGVGAGQMSRVDSVKLARTKAQLETRGTVLASDAFFPFRDGVDAAHEAGATAVVQPGGSVRDAEVIAAADEHGMAMVCTGARHFRH